MTDEPVDTTADNTQQPSGAANSPIVSPQQKAAPPISQVKQGAEDLISKANAAASRQEAANKELSLLLERQERMKVESTLSGTAATNVAQPPDESPADYAKKVMANEQETTP